MPGNSSSLTKSGSALFYLMELRLFRLLALNLSKALPSFLFPSSGEFISKRVSAPELFTWTEFYFESKSFGISPSALSLFLDLAAFWVPRPENLRARAVIGPLTPSFFSAKWVSITLFYLKRTELLFWKVFRKGAEYCVWCTTSVKSNFLAGMLRNYLNSSLD